MATISTTVALSVNSAAPINRSASYSVVQAGSNTAVLTQALSTGGGQISLGRVLNVPAAVLIRNLDSTNYVEVDGSSTYTSFPQKIPPGGAILLLPETTTIYARANGAACLIEVSACDA